MTPVSIGITVNRRPGYLLQSAGSVIAQTYRDWELMIGINPADAEAPQLLACAEALCGLDARIRIVSCPQCNSGFSKAKTILQHACYELCAAIDYDDLWEPDRLARQMPLIGRYDVVSAQAIYFGRKHGRRVPTPTGQLRAEHFRSFNPVVSPTVLGRAKDFRRIDPAYEHGPYDYKLWVDLLNEGRTFYAMPDVLALHRLADDSAYNAGMDRDVVARIGRMVR